MLQLNQTIFFFTHSLINPVAIYWLTGQGTEDTETKGNISDLKQLTGLPFPTSGLLTFLSPLPQMLFSSTPHPHQPKFLLCLNASFPLVQISPSSWILLLPASSSLQDGRDGFPLSEVTAHHPHSLEAMSHFSLKTTRSLEKELCQVHLCLWKNIRYHATQILITQLNLLEGTSLSEMHHVNEASLSLRFKN